MDLLKVKVKILICNIYLWTEVKDIAKFTKYLNVITVKNIHTANYESQGKRWRMLHDATFNVFDLKNVKIEK